MRAAVAENSIEGGFTPPYIAFKTLTGLNDRMVKEGAPARVDKSYLDNFSGGYQTQVLAALHALRLVDQEDGSLTDDFKDLVAAGTDEAVRKKVLERILRDRYAGIFALSGNSTQQQLVDAFGQLAPKVTGDTRRKAIAFFLGACQYAGIGVSKYWKTPRVQSRPGGPTRRQAKGEEPLDEREDDGDDETPSVKPSLKELPLRSGGIITIGMTVDLFSLSPTDRRFVFEIIDKMTEYENQGQLPAAQVVEGAPGQPGDPTPSIT